MPTSKTYLPDVNFWLALAVDSHEFHQTARRWFESSDDDSLAFCRVTQMGFLRLLTNPRVLGSNVLQQTESWEVYDRLQSDRRVFFAHDADPLVEPHWRHISLGPLNGRNLWTDAYLGAFSEVRGWSVATFDSDFSKLADAGASVTLLYE